MKTIKEHKHIKPDCKLCFAMWKNGYEQSKEDVIKLIDEFAKNVNSAGQRLLADINARISG